MFKEKFQGFYQEVGHQNKIFFSICSVALDVNKQFHLFSLFKYTIFANFTQFSLDFL